MSRNINKYLYTINNSIKMRKNHQIYENVINFVNENNVDDILIISLNPNDPEFIAIIDELLDLKKQISVLFLSKKMLKWKISLNRLNNILDINSFFNLKYSTNKIENNYQTDFVNNLFLCIDNVDIENKTTSIKNKKLFRFLKEINFKNKIGICFDAVIETNSKLSTNLIDLDLLISEKRIIK